MSCWKLEFLLPFSLLFLCWIQYNVTKSVISQCKRKCSRVYLHVSLSSFDLCLPPWVTKAGRLLTRDRQIPQQSSGFWLVETLARLLRCSSLCLQRLIWKWVYSNVAWLASSQEAWTVALAVSGCALRASPVTRISETTPTTATPASTPFPGPC